MIRINSITKSFGDRVVLDNISITASQGVTALVGVNGCGKTTLFDIISGDNYPDDGNITFPNNSSIVYLKQNAAYSFNSTVISELRISDKIKNELSELRNNEQIALEKIQSCIDNSLNVDNLMHIQDRINELEISIKRLPSPESILKSLGFSQDQFESPASNLSGGWQMRLALASLIFENPDIVLIDEPTNYLDLDSIRYFSNWLKDYKGTALVVSHDRHFLNSVSSEVWELFDAKITSYRGNYDNFIIQRNINFEHLKKKRKKQLIQMKELQAFIDKNRTNAATAARAQSRVKMLNKLEQELVTLPPAVPLMKLDFPDPPNCGKIAVSLENITHFFDDLQLFDGFSTIIENKRKIAVTGRNGFGKSTLLNIITGNLKPSQGTVEHYHSLDISYFKQDQINDLPKDVTVMEYMESITPFSHFHNINSILASFMFFKDSWDKKISILSGGEKVRLCFIKLILNAGNLIILDEPTTHLDINSRDILINALKKLDSTLIFVSHDTYFTDSLADTVFYFSSTRSIEKFDGNLSEFFDHRPEETKGNELKISTENYLEINKNAIDYELMKKNRNKIKLLEKRVSDLEKEIELKEKEKNNITVKLSSDTADYAELGAKLKNIEIFLEKLVNDWENALEEIEVLKNVEKNS